MKTTRIVMTGLWVLGLTTLVARAQFTLPYTGSASTSGWTFRVDNTYTGNIVPITGGIGAGYFSCSHSLGCGVHAEAIRTGVFGTASASQGTGVYGTCTANGSGVKGEAKAGGYGVYGLAEGSGAVEPHYGGCFDGQGKYGCGILALCGDFGYAADFHGPVVIRSRAGTEVMDLGEGLDYAEGFNVTKKEEVGPGTVLIIDPDHPGKLTQSTMVYDTKVAGIIAGAKGLGSGVRLGTGQFDQNVALAGRVYCNVDATETAVRPGDLLTTSALAGYAMKASDPVLRSGRHFGQSHGEPRAGQEGPNPGPGNLAVA